MALASTTPYAEIARRLGCETSSVKNKSQRLRLRSNRNYSPDQVAFIRAHYGKMPAQQIATRLGRTITSIYQIADRLGLMVKRPKRGPEFFARIRELHAQGYSDSEIGQDLGVTRKSIEDRRNQLGLPSNAFSARRRARVAAKTQEQLRQVGATSLGQVRVMAFRERARQAGWPEDLRPRAVQMLNAMWDRGPMTRRELADAIGMPWKGSCKSLVSNDPEGSYLAHLMKRGLVVCLGRLRRGKGKGHSVCVYSLPLWIERGQPEGVSNAAA